jgi:hypothetical protein
MNYRLDFSPPLPFASPKFQKAYELIKEMSLQDSTGFGYQGRMDLAYLVFEDKDQAMIFKLRL